MLALHAPVGEQLQLAAQQRVVIGRQAAGIGLRLPAHQCRNGVAHERVGLRGRGRAQRVEVQALAEVAQQQKALCHVLRQHFRGIQAGAAMQLGDVHERPHVFM